VAWLTIAGLVFDLLGAAVLAFGLFIDEDEALKLGQSYNSGDRREENLQLPPVKAGSGNPDERSSGCSCSPSGSFCRSLRAGPELFLAFRRCSELVIRPAFEEAVMVRLVPLAGVPVLAVVLLAGCGGGNDRAKVEASLRQYISGFSPDQGPFPIGAGPPRVRNNSCTDRHVKVKKGQALISRTLTVYLPDGLALWSCVVKFRSLAQPVLVGVKGGTKVVWATPGKFEDFELK
jgi:hypothetical protein